MGATPGNTERRTVDIPILGGTYTVKELTLGAQGEIENFIRSKYMRLYRESAIGMDPDEIHKRVMEILRADISIEELKDQMDTADCQLFVAYIAIRDNPDITLQNYQDILDADAVVAISDAVGGMSDDDVNPTQATPENGSDGTK